MLLSQFLSVKLHPYVLHFMSVLLNLLADFEMKLYILLLCIFVASNDRSATKGVGKKIKSVR